jgi:cbb3-type cytochrome oxidase maturation protein
VESLYLLIPLSVGLVLLILGVFGWALQRGQFEDLDFEAERILSAEPAAASVAVDAGQYGPQHLPKESSHQQQARP